MRPKKRRGVSDTAFTSHSTFAPQPTRPPVGNPVALTRYGAIILLLGILGAIFGFLVGEITPSPENGLRSLRHAIPTSADGVASLRDALVTAQVSRMMEEAQLTGIGKEEKGAARIDRENLLALSYRLKLLAMPPDRQKAEALEFLAAKLTKEQMLYDRLALDAQGEMQRNPVAFWQDGFVIGPGLILWSAAGGGLGLLFGFAVALFADRKCRIPLTHKVLLSTSMARDLGTLPKVESLALWPSIWKLADGPGAAERSAFERSSLARTIPERFRSIAFSILISDWDTGVRSYVVASPNSQDGRTTTVANLGIALSKAGLRVVLVDGDLARPSLHNFFEVGNGFGMRDVLRGRANLGTVPIQALALPTRFENVAVVTGSEGAEDASELLRSPHLTLLFKLLRQNFDIVLVDSPPMLEAEHAIDLARQCGGAILVFGSEHTVREEAAAVQKHFNRSNVTVVGTILNAYELPQEERQLAVAGRA